ncbi:hypothetical protein DFP72DRAFT_906850 [Ephemerocybe angulata]|uniref:F-box domain-containing protein n=1 Tax=Ephemerocybe angulata TaxID=980116 RepID=A0A8H6HR70_9AGAR|nr:hypothetical protein DFP72DRAFT_906850 [Tulosesus angulatus]
MNKCLQAPEILHLICNELPNSNLDDRQRLLAVALSCRALLEPGLDRLWHTIRSFQPLMTMLPLDLFKLEKKPNLGTSGFYLLVNLRREIVPSDLDRYLTYYAPRIREVDIALLKGTFSPEFWQGLQLATGWRHGALSPSAWKVVWTLTAPFQSLLSQDILDQTFAYFSLFLGPKSTCVTFGFKSEVPLQAASIRNAPSIPTALKELSLQDASPIASELSFLTSSIQSSSWRDLEGLTILNLPPNAISHLSTLPHLSRLEIGELHDTRPVRSYTQADITNRPGHLSTMSTGVFRSLKYLKLSSAVSANFEGFLQHLPPNNQLHTLKCILGVAPSSARVKAILATIHLHCNPKHFRELVIKGSPGTAANKERLDTYWDIGIDLNPLLIFTQLETLSLNLLLGVNLNPADINQIVARFPRLVKLNVDTDAFDSRIPQIDHTHVLQLIYKLRHLRKLGLRFNATAIPEYPANDPALANLTTAKHLPSQLVTLWVGDSPIYSPPSVARFFKMHCPNLRMDRIITLPIDSNIPETMPVVMYQKRWRALEDQDV